MAAPNTEKATAEHDDLLVNMLEQAHASSLLQLEVAKLRIAHHEKLAGLCAGTLALSFTAATAFHPQRATEMLSAPSLLHAWQLPLCSIVLAVGSNWLLVTGIHHFGNVQFVQQVGVRFSLLYGSLVRLDPKYAQEQRNAWERDSAKYARSARLFGLFIRLGALIGFLAHVAAFSALISLYFFAKAVLMRQGT